LVEIGDRLRREAARALLHRPRDAVDFGGMNRYPLTGTQSVGGGLGGRHNNRQDEHAGPPATQSHAIANRHCTLMLAARMTFAHLSISHLMRSANCVGVLAIGSKPNAARRSRTSASATTLTISRWSRSTTSCGVPPGTSTPRMISDS